jgi:DNA polymerase-1
MQPKIKDMLIDDPQDIGTVLNAIERVDEAAIDVETTGLDIKRDQLHGVAVSVGDPGNDWYVTGPAMYAFMPELKTLTDNHNKTFALHNAKFDLHFLSPFGINPVNMFDTMVAQWLVNENQGLKLKELAWTKLGVRDPLPEFKDLQKIVKAELGLKRMDQVTIFDIPNHILVPYAARDTRLTLDLMRKSKYELVEEGMTEQFYEIEMPFVKILHNMEATGMYVDLPTLSALQREFSERIEEYQARWDEITEGVNHNSPQQLGKLLTEDLGLAIDRKTPTGQPKVDIITLMRLKHEDKSGTVDTLLELRKYEKLLGTYLNAFATKNYNSRVHGGLNSTGTVTGRIASSKPNLQNVPSRTDLGRRVRGVFQAPPGYLLVVIDYSQIELRLLTHFSQASTLMRVFQEEGDPHQVTADGIGAERYVGKTVNFLWVYGGGPYKLADTMEKDGYPRPPESLAREWLDGFNRTHPDLPRWKQQLLRQARKEGGITTMWGHKRRLPDLYSRDKYIRGGAERQTINALIQGSAADAMKYAMLETSKVLSWWGDVRLLNQVHDELVWEVQEDAAVEFAMYAKKKLQSIKERFNLTVPILAEGGPGRTWVDAK